MAPTSKTTDAYACLEPWLPTLQQIGAPEYDGCAFPEDAVGPPVLWHGGFQMFQPDAAKRPLNGVCEALSLLALLARVDLEAWKKTVVKIWPQSWQLKEMLEELAPGERFVFGFGLNELTTQTVESTARFRDYDAHEAPPSEAFLRLRDDLMAKTESAGDGDDDDYLTIRVAIELDCCDVSCGAAATMLRRTLELVKAEKSMVCTRQTQARDGTEQVERPRFTITNVSFGTTVGVKLSLPGLKILQQLAQLGVRLSHLPPLEIDFMPPDTPSFIQTLRDIACLDDSDGPQKLGARTITVSDKDSAHLIHALLTTVQHSSKVQVIEIDLGNGDDLWFADQSDEWEWVALTVFSRYANHNIDTLELNTERLQTVEVNAVRDVLQAQNPFATTIRRNLTRLPDSVPHQITASRFFLDNEDEKPVILFEAQQPIAVRVLEPPIEDEHFYWSVLLPGHGVVSVHRDDVLSSPQDDLVLANRVITETPVFRRIDIIKMSEDSMEPVADLLDLIGKDTQRIDFYEQTDDVPVDQWCQRVLASCPRLEEFQIRHAQVDDLEAFVAAASQSKCRLRELLLSIVPSGETAHCVRVFFEALCHPSHPLAEKLRKLFICIFVETEDAHAVIKPILRMLRENRCLWSFRLKIQLPGPAKVLLPEFEAAFQGLSDDIVSIRTAPLEVCKKVAFLSVIEHCSRIAGKSVVGRLDTSIVTIVFEFAAQARARNVVITFGRPWSIDDEHDEDDEGEEINEAGY